MLIESYSTPNPETLKFVPQSKVSSCTANYRRESYFGGTKLLDILFAFPEVLAVLLASNFITVTKTPESSWDNLKPLLVEAMSEYFSSPNPFINNRLLGKLANVEEFEEGPEHRTGVYMDVHEDPSTGPTYKLPTGVEFPKKSNGSPAPTALEAQIVQQIRTIIETKVQPAVAQDGGSIVYKDFINGVVYLKLEGACSGCPSASITLKDGVENMLKYYVPEVVAVEAA